VLFFGRVATDQLPTLSRPPIPAPPTSPFSLDEPGPYENAQMTTGRRGRDADDLRDLRRGQSRRPKSAQNADAGVTTQRMTDRNEQVFVHFQ